MGSAWQRPHRMAGPPAGCGKGLVAVLYNLGQNTTQDLLFGLLENIFQPHSTVCLFSIITHTKQRMFSNARDG